jgi:hypothetical protein
MVMEDVADTSDVHDASVFMYERFKVFELVCL